MIGPGEIFTLFFVTLGPEKVIGPFAQQTRVLEPAALRGIALRVFVLSLFAVGVGGFFGRHLVHRWHISIPALLISTGIIFFLVALRVVLEEYPLTPSIGVNLRDSYVGSHYGLDSDSNAALLRGTVPHKLFGLAQILRATLSIVTTPNIAPHGRQTGLGDINPVRPVPVQGKDTSSSASDRN